MMIDLHVHLCDASLLPALLAYCDQAGIERAGLVSLPIPYTMRRESPEAGSAPLTPLIGATFNDAIAEVLRLCPERFVGFGALAHPFSQYGTPKSQVERLQEQGFSGVKIWEGKPGIDSHFGVRTADAAIIEAFRRAGELSMPVLYHVADPPPFWEAGGPYEHHGSGTPFRTFEEYIEEMVWCAEAAPDTRFIIAHMGFLAGGLNRLGTLLERLPNIYLDLAPGRWFFAELAREAEEVKRLLVDFSSRFLLGSDAMFLPPGFPIFGEPDVAENLKTFRRIRDFLCTDGMVDDPFPGAVNPSVKGLGLASGSPAERQAAEMICRKNGARIIANMREYGTKSIGRS